MPLLGAVALRGLSGPKRPDKRLRVTKKLTCALKTLRG
jgi:hypothetical protein